jgi:hypothetical protein
MAAALLTNILFWSGAAIGGIVFAALLQVTGAEWAGPLRSIAERFRRFLPISFLAILILMWRSADVYPWARQTAANTWLGPTLTTVRVAATCAVVYAGAFAFCRASRRMWNETAKHAVTAIAVAFLILYAVGFSLITVDLIMSLEPQWTSTLFPAYVFSGNVYAGMVTVAVFATWNAAGPERTMSSERSRDLANVLAAAALFWAYLFWSQFLVIWYGNLSSEVPYLMSRLERRPVIAWTVLVLACALPAIVFVPRWGKRRQAIKVVAPLILIGLWLEKWLLIAPSVETASSKLAGSLVTAAFAVVFFAAVQSEWRPGKSNLRQV